MNRDIKLGGSSISKVRVPQDEHQRSQKYAVSHLTWNYLKEGLEIRYMQECHDDEYKEGHNHSPKSGPHVDSKLSHINKDEKYQKGNTQPVSESTH